MEEAGLKIKITADVRNALLNIANLTDATGELAVEGVGNITAINEALGELRKAQKDVGDPKSLSTVNRAIKDLSKESVRLRNVGVPGFNELGEKIKEVGPAAESAGKGLAGAANSAFGALRKIAYVLPGIGIAGIFGLAGSAILGAAESLGIFNGDLFKTSVVEKRAADDAKHLADVLLKLQDSTDISRSAAGGEAGDIARVRALAAAIQDTNKTYQERKNALDQLRETNKAYFGDLTLEEASLKTLTARVNEYSQALIAEAIVKGQVEEIAKVSSELAKQEKVLEKLKTARDQALAAQRDTKITSTGGGVGTVGGTNISEETQLARAVKRTEDAYQSQRNAVLELRTAIASSNGELEKAIAQQIQFKPLKDVKETADKTGKSIEGLLEKIKRAQEELSKPNKDPLFKQLGAALSPDDLNGISLLRQQIANAIVEGNKIGTDRAKGLAKELGDLYEQQIKRIQNPDLKSHVDFTLADPADVTKAADKLESRVLKEFGKPIKVEIPLQIKEELEAFDQGSGGISLRKAIQEAGKALGDITPFTIPIRIQLEKKEISDQLDKQLGEALNPANLEKKFSTDAFANFGQAIGDALASGKDPIVAAGKSILTALGSLIQDIGKYLIEYGVAKQFLDTVLSSGIALPGVVAIGLGVAAEAIGALVKNVGQSYHAFATGGIVTGPTLGLVGEAGPEVIFPLNQLNRFIQGTRGAASTDVNVRGIVSGNNLRLVLARSNKNQSLV